MREVGDLLGIHPEALRHWVTKAGVVDRYASTVRITARP